MPIEHEIKQIAMYPFDFPLRVNAQQYELEAYAKLRLWAWIQITCDRHGTDRLETGRKLLIFSVIFQLF